MPVLAQNKATFLMNLPTVDKYVMLDLGVAWKKHDWIKEIALGMETFCGVLSDRLAL